MLQHNRCTDVKDYSENYNSLAWLKISAIAGAGWCEMHSGISWAMKDPSVESSKFGQRRLHFLAAFEGAFEMGQPWLHRCDAFSLQMQPLKDAAPELGHS